MNLHRLHRFRFIVFILDSWEVLNGVGVDGVGEILPFTFLRFFLFFVSSFFFAFLCFS